MGIEHAPRKPPHVALLERIESSKGLVPLIARPVVAPMLNEFAAYIVAMESRVAALEEKHGKG